MECSKTVKIEKPACTMAVIFRRNCRFSSRERVCNLAADVLKTKVASVRAPKLICIHSIEERKGYLKRAQQLLR